MGSYEELVAFTQARADERARDISWSGDAVVAWLTYLDPEGHILYTTVAARHHDEEPWVAAGKPLEEPSRARVIYDPARARPEVAMRRAILGLWDRCSQMIGEAEGDPREVQIRRAVRMGVRHALAAVAAIDRDHPDYQREWEQ